MPGFLYYLPGETQGELVAHNQFKPETMERWKLNISLSDCTVHPDHILVRDVKGPDDQMGLLLVPRPLDGQIPCKSYLPEHQEWRRAEDASGKWIGWQRDQPPGPQDLVKRDALSAKWFFKDAKDGEWVIVTARSSNEGVVSLPTTYTFKDNVMISRVTPRYQSLFELSGAVYDHMAVLFSMDEETTDFMMDEASLVQAAIQVLGVNYRVAVAELTALDELNYEILKAESVSGILMCFIDRPILDEFQKWNEALREKKSLGPAPTSPSSSSSLEDSIPTIDPQDVDLLSQKS